MLPPVCECGHVTQRRPGRGAGLRTAARRPAAGRHSGGAEIVTAKKFSPDPNERFRKMSGGGVAGGGPGTVISTGNYNSALFPGFEQAAVGQECSKGKGLVRKSRIATNQL